MRQNSVPTMESADPAVSPRVILVNAFKDPFNNAVAAARTCYAPRVVAPEDVDRDDASRAQAAGIARSVYQAGHHTTLQHAHFQFSLERVSRQFLWSFLHSHPNYNSEQVSQRYVTVAPGNVTVPPLEGKARELFVKTAGELMAAYQELVEALTPAVAKEYGRLFPLRNVKEKPWAKAVQRRAQEAARYVLPVATQAHLYHTVSALTLFRYRRLCELYDAPWEQRQVVDLMVAEVARVDPLLIKLMEDPLPLEKTPEHELFEMFHGKGGRKQTRDFLREFDASLGGRSSKLVDWKVHGEATLAQSVRSVLGATRASLSDDEAIDRLLNPARNAYLSEALNLAAHAKVQRAFAHMHFTFRKKISHSADSQDQRHRLTPATRPILAAHFAPEKPDYIVPALVWETPGALEVYEETLEKLWQAITALLNMGVKEEFALYLLPNAVSVRFEESGDLLGFHHKWVKRLCYTAQEEIWNACKDEVEQIKEVAPRVAKHIAAPCALRAAAQTRPFCPEGDRFCGVVVWKLPIEKYERLI